MSNHFEHTNTVFMAVICAFLILMATIEAVPHPKHTHQPDTSPGDSSTLDGNIAAESGNGDLQGSSSFGHGYYSYPYLGSGYHGGYYPYHGGAYGLGYPYYGGYYGGYHGFHGHYW